MEDYVFEIIWKIAGAIIASIIIVRAAWSKVKEKQKINDLAMYATVEAERQKWKAEEGGSADS